MGGKAARMTISADMVRWVALPAGPVLALLAAWLPGEALDPAARATAGVAVLMALWWMTEAIPLPATALLPVVLFPLLGVMPVGEATAPYASEIIFLFLGGFLIGLAMRRWRLHERVALNIVTLVGTQPSRLVGGFMLASALLSMWISNTATAIMLLPVGVSTLVLLRERAAEPDHPGYRNLEISLMLGVAYGASIGGLGTLLGSPPNIVLANFVNRELGIEFGMLDWMRYGLPAVAVLLPLTWLYLSRWRFPARLPADESGAGAVRAALAELGPMSRGERVVAAVFALAAAGWVLRPQLADLPGLGGLTDVGVAMCAALALFLIPVHPRRRVFALDWDTARDLPWGILLLFGGGLSLAHGIGSSGLDTWIASGVGGLAGLPLAVVLLSVVVLVVFLTELTSNTATANTFIPILAAVGAGLALPVLPITMAAALAASCAFMLPVATPPNAVVFASGYVGIRDMVRAGLGLNVLAVAVIAALSWVLARGAG